MFARSRVVLMCGPSLAHASTPARSVEPACADEAARRAPLMRGSQRGLFCEYVDEGHVRTGGASVRRTRSCLRALNGRQILSRLAAIGHDFALALFWGI